jgi:hypothetical protein
VVSSKGEEMWECVVMVVREMRVIEAELESYRMQAAAQPLRNVPHPAGYSQLGGRIMRRR